MARTGNLPLAGIVVVAVLLAFGPTLSAAEKPDRATQTDAARQILEAAEVEGGLIVHVGCGSGRLTAALAANGSYLVHGLDTEVAEVARARRHIQGLGLYGPVSVDRFDGARLPHADNLVNLLVAEDLGGVTAEEAMRVLAPGGAMLVKQDGRWRKTLKPHPQDTDEWTHYLHDASGNPVARDRVVGPPRHVQWVEGPRYTRSHEHTPGIIALVSSGGRVFYVADEGSIASIRRPGQWNLLARDAYNGILLWKQPTTSWFSHLCGWTQGPLQLQRKLVAVGDRVYVALGFHAPLSAVDAATGKTLRVYEQTRGTEEILWHRGILLLVVRSVTDERVAELAKWARLAEKKESPLYARESMLPLVKHFRQTEAKAKLTVLALDADTGRVLWKKTGKDAALRSLSLCAIGDRVFYQKGGKIVCRDLKTGQKRWSVSAGRLRVVCETCVVYSNGKTIAALSAETGEKLWTRDALLSVIRDTFVIDGSLWLGGFKPYDTGRKHTGPAWGPYFVTQRDLDTGKVLKHIEPENPGHHHRCYVNKATDRYILAGRRGTEFIDLESGDVLWNSWARGVCRYGVMPCNGLLYVPPHACGCYITAKLTGFHALAAKITPSESQAKDRLQRGPAYSQPIHHSSFITHQSRDWPTYRHDGGRSGSTRAAVPIALRPRWQADVGRKLSSPTVRNGRVFVASVDEHRIAALDAESGRPAWHFTAGGRVDSPPTLYQGRAIFGCRDGCVYSLRASDGALVWRLQPARPRRLIAAHGQLESTLPVPGSVLVRDGAAYFTAGRSSYLDGGIDLHRVDAHSGKRLSTTPIHSPDPETGKQPAQFGPNTMPGALADILAGDDQYVYLRDMVFDHQGVGQAKGNAHLLTLTGFLDDSWAHRSYWIFGTRCSLSTGCSGRDRNLVFARLFVFDESMIYGFGRGTVHWSNALQDGAYRLFAVRRGDSKPLWTKPMPIRVRAMVLAGEVLFAAGPAVGDGKQASLLVAASVSDGTELARYPLDDAPVLDGMAAAGGRLFISLENGRLVCMGL